MGNITDAKLAIVHDHTRKTAKVTVIGKLAFTPYELNEMKEGLRFKCGCELWGADSGLTGADDKLFTMTPKYFPDQSPALSEEVRFEVTVGEGVLDEDWGTDEVYAKLRLQNLYTLTQVSRKSNEVSHRF